MVAKGYGVYISCLDGLWKSCGVEVHENKAGDCGDS